MHEMAGFAAKWRPFLWTNSEGGNDEDDLESLKVRVVVMVGSPFGSSPPTLEGEHANESVCWGGELFVRWEWVVESEEVE